ncbi:MAG TPA: ABC transporter ATP-binding protein [Tianweitania sediminis]|jgi:peptide/nickel transport system ATP-binding protein/oligopeptide transport system ATP-binding protein|nr:ABC transporter ATP-binding protein [Tianweitania sediminis]
MLDPDAKPPLLELRDLRVSFPTSEGSAEALKGVELAVGRGEILCIVGESGSGKSLTSLSILRLISQPGWISGGEIIFDGADLLQLPEEQLRNVRGNRISMIFQEPMSSLNPLLRVGEQIAEPLMRHSGVSRKEATAQAVDMMRLVRIADPERRFNDYPHQFSGGMRQRVMIAIALVCKPELLIADEPTTALDVTIQAQVLDLILDLRDALGMSVILVTHDLGVVAETAERVAVMYAGRIVETAPAAELFDSPRHPYTRRLLAAMPGRTERGHRLADIPGIAPPLSEPPSGCGFCPRFEGLSGGCRTEVPPMVEVAPHHHVRCWHHSAGAAL